MSKHLQGKFKPKNPHKYIGDSSNIIYRSSWEMTVMNYLDLREEVQSWQSEEKFVVYYDPITKKNRRYFPDFVVKFKNSKGEIVVEMIEVKPKSEVDGPPENPKRKQRAGQLESKRTSRIRLNGKPLENTVQQKDGTSVS
ncbi:head completion protein [Synechococcus phage S-CRM01]|uniref:head closure n=1 Tax=Synechococcus phage S-CRM01 TaxID=1026955 RepID=UPI000209E36A|nr:head closure [Synechococcus phage S-CRM01]AEC53011.1 head completion protein [Synechococcus phage S-CRM01]